MASHEMRGEITGGFPSFTYENQKASGRASSRLRGVCMSPNNVVLEV